MKRARDTFRAMSWKRFGKRRSVLVALAGFFCLTGLLLATELGSVFVNYMRVRLGGGYTTADRLEMHGAAVEGRLQPAFAAANLFYPPSEIAFIAIKQKRELQLYARPSPDTVWTHVRTYPVLAQSGHLGPKLREGDGQVPEGIYRAEFLNPNSLYHVSIRLNYPNAVDMAAARADGRTNLGSDIMIHGSKYSIGCLALGDEAAEDLFVLAAIVGKEWVKVVISPVDFRVPGTKAPDTDRPWIQSLYATLARELGNFPLVPTVSR
jgi:L,D-transpeptidase catalytic domain